MFPGGLASGPQAVLYVGDRTTKQPIGTGKLVAFRGDCQAEAEALACEQGYGWQCPPSPEWNDSDAQTWKTPKAAVVTGNTFIRDRSGASVEVGRSKEAARTRLVCYIRYRSNREVPIPPAAAPTTPTTGSDHTQRVSGVQTCRVEWATP